VEEKQRRTDKVGSPVITGSVFLMTPRWLLSLETDTREGEGGDAISLERGRFARDG